jgi:very-short-patch-repair endonuclease
MCTKTQKILCGDDYCETCFDRSFASHKKAKYWSEKNEIMSKEAFICSGKKYIFDCKCGHEFTAMLSNVSKGKWCQYCSNQKLCNDDNCEQCFEKSFASYKKAKFWSDSNSELPRNVLRNSNIKYNFNCKCGHEFCADLNHISKGTWCPYCANPSRKLCNNNDCNQCFNKSFASHKKAKFWSDSNEESPRNVFKSAANKYKFNCKCNHEFIISLDSVNRGAWCSYCSNQQLCNNNNCDECFNKSFASHKKAKFWSDSNEESPRCVFKGSQKKYVFDCKCGHEFKSSLANIYKGRWCPYCSKPAKQLCDDKNCNMCFENSFASHTKMKFWSNKNSDVPRNIFKGSDKKYIFNCKCGHEFCANLHSITIGSWCPICKNKTEKKLYDWLLKQEPTTIHQAKYKWCKNKQLLPFDFAIEELNLIIELDGRQHFKQVSNWKDPESTQFRDIYKMNKAIEKGYTVIRLLQEDVYNDKNNWKKKLLKHLRFHNKPRCIFLCSNNEYDSIKSKMESD